MATAERVEYSFSYKDKKHGWLSGGQTFTNRAQCVGVATRYGTTSAVPVRLNTLTTVTVIEDLPLPDQT